MKKKNGGATISFRGFSKFYENQKFVELNFLNSECPGVILMVRPLNKFGPDRFSRFSVTNKLTNRQAKYVYIYRLIDK